MAAFTVEVLPNPAQDEATLREYSTRLKALRLRSLKEDPKSFSSRHESEVKQPENFWLDRLRDQRASHLILARDDGTTHQPTLLEKEWVGFVVIVGPAAGDGVIQSSSREWFMAALYVMPELRGQGLGETLVRASIRYVKDHGATQDDQTLEYVTSVLHGNKRALELYRRLGFGIIDPEERLEKEGRVSLATKLKFDFQQVR
jgi:ribosomal protein S18 acetylase RimI-like enzyme